MNPFHDPTCHGNSSRNPRGSPPTISCIQIGKWKGNWCDSEFGIGHTRSRRRHSPFVKRIGKEDTTSSPCICRGSLLAAGVEVQLFAYGHHRFRREGLIPRFASPPRPVGPRSPITTKLRHQNGWHPVLYSQVTKKKSPIQSKRSTAFSPQQARLSC